MVLVLALAVGSARSAAGAAPQVETFRFAAGPFVVIRLDTFSGAIKVETDSQPEVRIQVITTELVGGTPEVNAQVVKRVMAGEHGAHRNIVVLNAAAALVVAGVAESLEDGLLMAATAIDSGAAAATLDRFVAVSQQAAAEFGH